MGTVDGDHTLNGHIAVDETVIGGYRRGGNRGRLAPGKPIVLGMLERGGSIMTTGVSNVRKSTLAPPILTNVKQPSTISIDALPSYNQLQKLGYHHDSVNHSHAEWVKGIHHTNSIEGCWFQLKRSIHGTPIHVSGKHLATSLVECEYRFNLRQAPDQLFPRLLASF